MSSHVFHPDVWDPHLNSGGDCPVLFDGCCRCDEISVDPLNRLDAARLQELRRRTFEGDGHKSALDLRAARVLAVPA